MLESHFAQFGTILATQVRIKTDKSLGFGFVHFRDEESAEKAISSMNGSLLFGLELTVMKSTSSQGGTSGYTNVFVGNIDFGSEEEVRNVFSRFGKITRVVFSQDKRGRPFACVNFSNNSEAQDAINTMNGVSLDEGDIPLECRFTRSSREFESNRLVLGPTRDASDSLMRSAQRQQHLQNVQTRYQQNQSPAPKPAPSPSTAAPTRCTLLVEHLDTSIDTNRLKWEFARFASVVDAEVALDKDSGASQGYGFVTFRSLADAERAKQGMRFTESISSRPLHVSILPTERPLSPPDTSSL